MSNQTVQTIINQGYYPVDQQTFSVVSAAPVQITTLATKVNMIRIKIPVDISGGARAFIGNSSVTTANGFPLFDYNGAAQVSNTMAPFDILTSDPSQWYLISNIGGGMDVRVLFLAQIGS